MVVVSGPDAVHFLEELMDIAEDRSQSGLQVMVEVKGILEAVEPPVADVAPDVIPMARRTAFVAERKEMPSRPLFINNKRVRNAILLF